MRNLLLAPVLFMIACGGKVSPAPQPFRPEIVADTSGGPEPPKGGAADCGPIVEVGVTSFDDREIPAGKELAAQGEEELATARGQTGESHDRGITHAVEILLKALDFDPYNVDATYELAAAYAVIERPQCSLNMLQRMIYMRKHASKKKDVERRLDQLLGRGSKDLDPAFENLWSDPRWKDMIDSICGRDEKDCVYGK